MLIDCLIWNNKFEADLLWLKLFHQPMVDYFCISHASHDYHGKFKGDTLTEVLKDPKFLPFLGRITVFYINRNLSSSPNDESQIDPQTYANAEWELRDAPTQYLLDTFKDSDRVITSDVDEFFDQTDNIRSNRFWQEIKTKDAIQFDRVRYIYDYDNRAFREYGDMITPSYLIGHLRSGAAKLRDKKWKGRIVGNEDNPVCFEYCHVFPTKEDYISKHMSSLHTQWSEYYLNLALETNTWPRTNYQHHMPDKNNRWHWFKKVNPHKNNSPQYVIDNLDKLKTNLVPENYIENRLRLYGFDGQFPENKDFEE